MKANGEAHGTLVFDVPQAPNDGRNASSQEGVRKAERSFARGYGPALGSTGCQYHKSRVGEVQVQDVASKKLPRLTVLRRKQQARAGGVSGDFHSMHCKMCDVGIF
jgi:hypothetical protein